MISIQFSEKADKPETTVQDCVSTFVSTIVARHSISICVCDDRTM